VARSNEKYEEVCEGLQHMSKNEKSNRATSRKIKVE